MKFVGIIGIMIMAVFLGYLTAKFVIGPVLGYNADESPIKIAGNESDKSVESEETKSKDNSKSEEAAAGSTENAEEKTKAEVEEESQEEGSSKATVPEEGYALQFGVFSTKEAADAMVSSLQAKGIETEIIEADNMYKVISPVIKTKNEALTKLDEVKNQDIEDVFIASF